MLTAFISPFRKDREWVRSLMPHGDFFEIYCRCSLEICDSRDVKGLYKRARAGGIRDFIGISSLYEAPDAPELVVNTAAQSLDACVMRVLDLLKARGVIA